MKKFYNFLLILLIIPLLIHELYPMENLDDAKLEKNTILFPAAYDLNDFNWSVGMLATTLPKDWVETAIKAPLFTFNFRYGLPAGFSVPAVFEFLIVSNQLRLGPRWGHNFGNFSFELGYDIGYVFGALNQFGFRNRISAWYNYPNLTLGYRAGDLFFTLQGELMYITSRTLTTDGIETSNDKNSLPGGTISLSLEQALWKDKIFIVGLKANITKFYYIAWPAFTTFNKIYMIPQLQLGVVL